MFAKKGFALNSLSSYLHEENNLLVIHLAKCKSWPFTKEEKDVLKKKP